MMWLWLGFGYAGLACLFALMVTWILWFVGGFGVACGFWGGGLCVVVVRLVFGLRLRGVCF